MADSREDVDNVKAELAELGKKLGFRPGFEDSLYFPESPNEYHFYREFAKVVAAASEFTARAFGFLETFRVPDRANPEMGTAPLYDGFAEYRREPFPHVFIRVPEVPSRMGVTMKNRRQVGFHWRNLIYEATAGLKVPPEPEFHFKKTFVYIRYCIFSRYGVGADADNYPTRMIINALKAWLLPDDSWNRVAYGVEVERVSDRSRTEIFLMDHARARERLFGGLLGGS